MTDFAPPRGMRDFYPEDFRLREALFETWRRSAVLYGFEFWDSPVVESLELLERKAGEEISEQLYTFTDKSDRRLALRAELTPSLARMLIARQGSLAFPVKWAAIGQCFRYERMTRGRKREHYQLNLDIIGEPGIVAEAEVIGAAVASLRAMGLTSEDFKVRIGSRALLSALFARSGLGEEHFAACCLALDKRGKISDEEVAGLLIKEGLRPEDVGRAFELLALRTLDEVAARVDESSPEDVPSAAPADPSNVTPAADPARAALADLRDLFRIATELGFADFLRFDLGVIRGLGYYTGIVFEAFDTQNKFRALFGGGRYNNLLQALGGGDMPCVGLGFGDVVVMELLGELGKLPKHTNEVAYAVGYMDAAAQPLALKIAARLREASVPCDLGLKAEKPKKFFDRANKIGAVQAIYLGPDEIAKGAFNVKPMRGGDAREATLDTLESI